MDVGVIGMGEVGQSVLAQLEQKTMHNLFAYDPDGRAPDSAAARCATAAELVSRCGAVVVALESAGDLVALCNGVSPYLREAQTWIDLTEISPALAHKISNGMRRLGVRYIDCGLVGEHGLNPPFMLFAGGAGRAFAQALPLIRCFAPGCRYMGPAGRGQAVRLLCRDLCLRIGREAERTAALAGALGIERAAFLDALQLFEQTARPLSVLTGEAPAFPPEQLKKDAELVARMRRRAFAGRRARDAAE